MAVEATGADARDCCNACPTPQDELTSPQPSCCPHRPEFACRPRRETTDPSQTKEFKGSCLKLDELQRENKAGCCKGASAGQGLKALRQSEAERESSSASNMECSCTALPKQLAATCAVQ